MSSAFDRLRARIARRLETGDPSAPARAAAAIWALAAARAVARPLAIPEGVRLVGVGGAVLGGAGKTPLAVALTRALAEHGERPALLGHAYRARPSRPHVVDPGEPLAEAGDDALAAARLLAGVAPVVVGARRRDALEHAAALGHRVIVADGLLQTAPRRLHAAILTLDAGAPWGSGACPPAGDLRAPRSDLLAAADHVAALLPDGAVLDPDLARLGAVPVPSRLAGAIAPGGERLPLADLRRRRLGLLLAIARPARVLAALAAEGIHPAVLVALGDHAVPGPRELAGAARAPVDGWLTTARCAVKLPPRLGAAPVWSLDQRLDVGGLLAVLPGFRDGRGPC